MVCLIYDVLFYAHLFSHFHLCLLNIVVYFQVLSFLESEIEGSCFQCPDLKPGVQLSEMKSSAFDALDSTFSM